MIFKKATYCSVVELVTTGHVQSVMRGIVGAVHIALFEGSYSKKVVI